VIDILAHRIAVMQSSLLVEEGERDAILNHAKDPYSQRSIAAVPVPDPAKQKKRREARLAS
jgi:peptide/nickel transport system ATP-binding protein